MFNGDLNKVAAYCEEIGAEYNIVEMAGTKFLYVHDKTEFRKRLEAVGKDQLLYVGYLRLSKHEDHDYLYGRYNGWCQYYSDKQVKEIIDDLTKGAA